MVRFMSSIRSTVQERLMESSVSGTIAHGHLTATFCWDSIIDKKLYETVLTLPKTIVDKMLIPSDRDYQKRDEYYHAVQIGLAPEGKAAVWVSGVARGEPNYRIIPSVQKTVSGDILVICKGITRFSHGYEYGKDTENFIKGKKYPYGLW